MVTGLALAGFLAVVGLPIYLMWGMPRAHRPAEMDSGEGTFVPSNSPPSPAFTEASHTASDGGGSDP